MADVRDGATQMQGVSGYRRPKRQSPYPCPPRAMINYVCGDVDESVYMQSALGVFTMLDLASRRYAGRGLDDHNRILDFGCGTGRLLQYLEPRQTVTGVDVNSAIVEWTRSHFSGFRILHSQNTPPLPLADNEVDLVYSYSVFSHLNRTNEFNWLEELHRVGAPGCLYLITVHGDWVIEATLSDEERRQAESCGFYFRGVHARDGSSLDFPDGYEASYHTSGFVYREWSSLFDIRRIFRGEHPVEYLFDSLQFHDPAGVPSFLPMGQALVVMRKR